ncbi:hypothetical protein Tco_1101007 [Tanacetum coccineum]
MVASAGANKLRCSLYSSLQPICQPLHEPASSVAAFPTACNLCGSLRSSVQPMWQPPQQPTTFVAAFTATFNLCRSLQTLWKPSHQPSTYLAAFVAACNLSCNIHSSVQPMWQPPQQPATFVAALSVYHKVNKDHALTTKDTLCESAMISLKLCTLRMHNIRLGGLMTYPSLRLRALPSLWEAITEVILYSASPPSPPYDLSDHHQNMDANASKSSATQSTTIEVDDFWEAVRDMYGNQNNSTPIFQIQLDIANLRQDGNSFINLLGKLKGLWNELEVYRPHSVVPKILRKKHEDDQVFQLLANLGPDFKELKRHILLNAELPTLKSVCATIQRKEIRRKVMINDATTPEARVYSANSSLDKNSYKGKH